MDSALVVPGDFVSDVRSGLFGEWGFAAEQLSVMALQLGGDASGGVFREPLELFDAGRALLDIVGWQREQADREIHIDLSAHHLYPTILSKALRNERTALAAYLDDIPCAGSDYARHSLRRRIAALEDLLVSIEGKAGQLMHPASTASRRSAFPRRSRACRA